MEIGHVTVNGKLYLAPMAGGTNTAVTAAASTAITGMALVLHHCSNFISTSHRPTGEQRINGSYNSTLSMKMQGRGGTKKRPFGTAAFSRCSSFTLSAHFRMWVTVWVRRLPHILSHT